MQNWKPILGACAIFLLGMIAGGLITVKVIQTRVRAALAGGPDAVAQLIVDRMSTVLKLDASQKEKLGVIVKETHAKLKKARQQVDPQVQEALTKAEDDIRQLLTTEQRDKFDKLAAERKSAWGEVRM